MRNLESADAADVKSTFVAFRSFWLYPVIAIVLLYSTSRYDSRTSYPDLLWLFLTGVVIWTLLEYCLHRFVFHFRPAVVNRRVRQVVQASHFEHHASPRDASKLLVGTSYGITVSSALFAVFYAVTGSLSAASVLLS